MITKTITRDDGSEVETEVRKLYTYAELKALDGSDEIATGAAQHAAEWLSMVNLETWDGDFEIEWLCTEIFPIAGIDVDRTYGKNRAGDRIPTGWDVSWAVGDRDEHFAIRRGDIDASKFLAALKVWASGQDIRDKAYAGASDWGKLSAGPRYQYRLDLRSRDARIIREQGVLLRQDAWGWHRASSTEVDFDYQYDEVSDRFKEAANAFISDLMHYALKVLRDDYEDQWSEDCIAGLAEANEYTFNRDGVRED